jgi:anaerobic selenocysteine-containing dehydrogenase
MIVLDGVPVKPHARKTSREREHALALTIASNGKTGKAVLPTPSGQNAQATHLQGSDTGQGQGHQGASPAGAKAGASPVRLLPPKIAFDLSLQHPRCVFQLLKKQYERYTPEMVERITGISQDQFLKAADCIASH